MIVKNKFLVDVIYNHDYLENILSLLKCINKNNDLSKILSFSSVEEIEENNKIYDVFINEIKNFKKYDKDEQIEKKKDQIHEYIKHTDNDQFVEEINVKKTEDENISTEKHRKIRIYADGVFDLVHSGHFNAIRQAKKLGDILVVGINSDQDILKSKGVFPIYTEEERGELIKGCKWADEVIIGTKYSVDMKMLKEYNCDYAAHGNDIVCDANSVYCYEDVKKHNRLKIFERSYGISTTALVNHLLQAVEEGSNSMKYIETESTNEILNDINNINYKNNVHEKNDINNINYKNNINKNLNYDKLKKKNDFNINTIKTKTYITASKLYQFMSFDEKKIKNKIVYVDGSFDIFHVGHLRILENAKKLGSFLLVGIHDDAVVRKMKGKYFPVVSLLERTLNVLSMKVVDDVVIGAPWVITEQFIKHFNIHIVVRGTKVDYFYLNNKIDPYKIPKALNIYKTIPSESSLTTFEIIQRIKKNKLILMNTIKQRCKKEENIWKTNKPNVLS